MNFPELISDTGFSACDSVRDAASGVMAWDAPAVASVGPVVSSAVSKEGALSGVPVGLVVWQAAGVAADAR
jgi:hypothetical protein